MSDVPALLAAFESGELLRPDPDVPNFLDLSRALGAACGVRGLTLSANARAIADRLEEHEHIVFVLADGLGLDMIEQGGDSANVLRAHLSMELRAIFPASTVVALTTLMTGEWPAQHAVTGWWTHLEEIGGPATVLPYVRRSDDRSLSDLGLRPEQVFPLPTQTPRMTRETLVLVPEAIAGSVYSRYGTGGEPAVGYDTLAEGVEQTIRAVLGADGPSFVYLYIPHLDQAAHEHGPWSAEANQALRGIDRLFGVLAHELRGQATIALSADHGHLGVGPGGAAADPRGRRAARAARRRARRRLARAALPRAPRRRRGVRRSLPRALRRGVPAAEDAGGGRAAALRAGATEPADRRAPRRLRRDLARGARARLPPLERRARAAAPRLAPLRAAARRSCASRCCSSRSGGLSSAQVSSARDRGGGKVANIARLPGWRRSTRCHRPSLSSANGSPGSASITNQASSRTSPSSCPAPQPE